MNVFEQAMDLCHSHDYHQGPEGCGPVALIEKLEEAGLLRSDVPDGDVMAFRTSGTNADVIADCFTLGYLTDGMSIFDATYGKGTFWKKHCPPKFVASDLHVRGLDGNGHGVQAWDFTSLPYNDGLFDATVFDPDYKMQGTSSNEGPASSNAAYGMDREYRPVVEQVSIIERGLDECFRVTEPGGMVLVKCMAQVVSGNVVWQDLNLLAAVPRTARLIDRFWLLGYRKQPERTHKCPDCKGDGFVENPNYCCPDDEPPSIDCESCEGTGREESVQQHSRQNASCLLVFKKAGRRAGL